MKNLDTPEDDKTNAERDTLKSLSLGIVSHLSQVLVDKGFAQKPIDIVEALIFAMFIIADTYSLAKPDKEQAVAVIHGFYDDMQDHFVRKIVIADHNLTEAAEIQSVSDKFHKLSRSRYTEYEEKFKQDIADSMGTKCATTVNYLLDNLAIDPLTTEEKLQLLGPVSDKVLYFWAGCVQHFKAQ